MAEKPSVYIETSIVGYLTMRPSRLQRVLADQATTRQWWETRRQEFALFVGDPVIEEAALGDPDAARERLAAIVEITRLARSSDADALAAAFLREVPLPRKAVVDALHIAIAAVNGIQFLLTWNCKHIANAQFQPAIGRVCESHDAMIPTLCTPPQLMTEVRRD